MGLGSNYLQRISLVALLSVAPLTSLYAQLKVDKPSFNLSHTRLIQKDELSPIFSDRGLEAQSLARYEEFENRFEHPTYSGRVESKLELTVEPVQTQFDSKSQVFTHTLKELLPHSSFLALSLEKRRNGANDNNKRRNYTRSISLRGGSGVVFKASYCIPQLNDLMLEGSVNQKKDVQISLPFAQFDLPLLPNNAIIKGGIIMDLKNTNPTRNKKPSIGLYGSW